MDAEGIDGTKGLDEDRSIMATEDLSRRLEEERNTTYDTGSAAIVSFKQVTPSSLICLFSPRHSDKFQLCFGRHLVAFSSKELEIPQSFFVSVFHEQPSWRLRNEPDSRGDKGGYNIVQAIRNHPSVVVLDLAGATTDAIDYDATDAETDLIGTNHQPANRTWHNF